MSTKKDKLKEVYSSNVPTPSGVLPMPAATAKTPFAATLAMVVHRGRPPLPFLEALLKWGKGAPDEIFAPNRVPNDAYAVIKPFLATERGQDASGTRVFVWDSPLHRRAAMLELMRVHAGLESSWKQEEAVDRTNKTSMQDKTGEEAGMFQVSFNSTWLDSVEGKDVMGNWLKANGVDDDKPETFIPRMKADLAFAMEFYARLVRVSIQWAGPLLRLTKDSVYPNLNRDAMLEFMRLLAA